MIRIPSLMRHCGAALGATLALLGAPVAPNAVQADPQRDPKADAVVDAALKAIAPEDGWSKIGGLRFTYSMVKDAKAVGVAHYVWDVHSGMCRIEWKEDNGNEHRVVFNVGGKGRIGHEYVRMGPRGEAAPPPGEAAPATAARPPRRPPTPRWIEEPALMARSTLLSSYERFVHDSYWLLMPLKLKDPGVNLGYDGEKKIGKQTYDVVKVTFDHATAGLADAYWIYVNRDTHLIDRCESTLPPAPPAEKGIKSDDANGSGKADEDKAAGKELWIWKEWKPLGPVKLATLKSLEDGSATVELQGVETMSTVAESEFQSPVEVRPRPAPSPHNG